LVYRESVAERGTDLGVLSLEEELPELLVATEFNERNAELSPDGRWLVYESEASGQYEIYVQPFPGVDEGRWQISTGGGSQPLWAPDGGQLFYLNPEGKLMAVTVRANPGFDHDRPEILLEADILFR